MKNWGTETVKRRDILKGIAAAGFLAAMPKSVLGDDASVFPKRGKWERLSLSCAHIELGAEKPFSLLHISDTHLTAAYSHEDERSRKLSKLRTETFGGRQEEALRDSIAWAAKNSDLLLHTGDLIDFVTDANLDLVKKYCPPNMFGAMGNHEYSRFMWLEKSSPTEEYKKLSAEALRKSFPFEISFASKVVNGVNFVSFDSVYGYVTQEQADRFSDEVKKKLPIILCMHVPFYTDRICIARKKFWQYGKRFTDARVPDAWGDQVRQLSDPTTAAFIKYLKTEPLLKGILAGHLHISMQERFSNTATQYLVAGNFLFHGREITFS